MTSGVLNISPTRTSSSRASAMIFPSTWFVGPPRARRGDYMYAHAASGVKGEALDPLRRFPGESGVSEIARRRASAQTGDRAKGSTFIRKFEMSSEKLKDLASSG